MGNLKFSLIIVFFLLQLTSLALAQTEETKGKIQSLTHSPAEPIVSEGTTISARIENPDTIDHEYNLIISVIKEGKIKYDERFNFVLKSGRAVTFSPVYTPDDIGEFEIIAKLYDKFQAEVVSTKLSSFSALSHIGPFDLDINIPSDVVRPNTKVPVVIQLLNMGDKGTDVEVKLKLSCVTTPDSVEKFIVFLKSKQSLKKITPITTCPEEGLHELSGEIILFNKTWLSSASQVFLNSSFVELSFDLPEKFQLARGESKTFDLPVTNLGNKVLHKLQLVVSVLPQNWVKITPNSVAEVKAQETAVFIVNLTIPPNAEETVYSFTISAAADETLLRKETNLKISSLASIEMETGKIFPSLPETLSAIPENVIYAIVIPLGLIIAIIVIKSIARTRISQQRFGLLNKVRQSVTSVPKKNINVITLDKLKQRLARKRL